MASSGPLRGRVEDFDDHRGYGTVAVAHPTGDAASSGHAGAGRRLFFHCTSIANGTRTIAVGTAVAFVVVPGHAGRYEAAAVTPL